MEEALRILLAQPRGFCAGVDRAIEIVERAIALYGSPVYVRHEIVHNHQVVERLRSLGAVFVDEVDAVPAGAVVVFSAHGVSPVVEDAAAARGLRVVDATCPLVHKVHVEGRRYARQDYDVVLIGHTGHAEVEGTRGQIGGRVHVIATAAEVDGLVVSDPERLAYVTQTTLSVSDTRDVVTALLKRFPAALGPHTDDICYATQNRQNAVSAMIGQIDLLLVIGSATSSNSNRLRELGAAAGCPSHLIDGAASLDPAWLNGVTAVGLTAGASAPEHLVQETVERLRSIRTVTVEKLPGIVEHVRFRLPPALAGNDATARPAA